MNARITLTLIALLCAVATPLHAETLTRSAMLSRTQIETTGANVSVSAADATPTTSHTLSIDLRFPEMPLAPSGGNAWNYTVRYRVTTGTTTGTTRRLTLFRGVDRDVFRAVDRIAPLAATNVRVDIDGVDTTDAAAVPNSIELEVRLESVRYSAFMRNVAPMLSQTAGAEPRLHWTAVAGAEEYEVESAFIDALDTVLAANAFTARLPVRFQTKDLSIPIDIYRSAGTVYYRVRAVGRHANDLQARRPGVWSAPLAVSVGQNGFAADKNWQYERRYDGDGPIQGALNYFDGALRLRQAQTGAPDQDSRRIAETKFDFEGRPAVNFLAVPQSGKRLDFVAGFNRATDDVPYGPQHFDRGTVVASSDTTGAGRYFSGNNTATDRVSSYLPDAEGFPFSVAEHTRDSSARLRAMSGFGKAQRLGGGHDTQYVYGDASEADLRPLFGSNLGDPRHYERTVVGDANRAFEVTYRDGSDRIIAQALVGDPPPNLSDLPNAPASQLRIVSMDASNRVDADAGRSTLTYRIANAVNTSYHFTYSPTGVEYSADPGDARFPPLCESCRYRLRIRILGPNGAPVPLAQGSTIQNDPSCDALSSTNVVSSLDQVIENPNPRTCSGAGDFTSGYMVPPVKFCAKLTEPGEYEVQKTLEFLDGDIDARIEVYERKPGFFDVNTGYRDPVDPASCGESCLAHCATATGVNPATTPNDPQLLKCVDQCEHPDKWVLDRVDENKCDSLENTMRQDMAPGGLHHRANAANALSDHPEYCHLGVCRTLEASDRYDLDMGVVETWDAAVCGGYLNPTALPASPGSPSAPAGCTPARDPFFASGGPGAALRGLIDNQLANFTATVSGWADAPLSIWQFVADPRVNSTGSGAGPTPDEQWRLFRSLYLGAKMRLVIQQTESPTGFDCPFSTAQNARVPKPPLPSTVVEVIDAIAGATEAQCSALCAVRVTQWLERLRGSCPSPANPAQLRQGLLEYCESSCGANNPLGLLIAEDLQRGAPGLADAMAGLGVGCSLDDITVEDPYVRQTVCGETCCSDSGPIECALKLVATLAERAPFAAGEDRAVTNTPAGRKLRAECLDWIEHVHFDSPRSLFVSKDGSRSCTVLLIAPDGSPLSLTDAQITGSPRIQPVPPPNAQGTSGLAYTRLVVDVEINGRRLVAAIYSDCPIPWSGPLKTPRCETTVRTDPPPVSCETKPDKKLLSVRSYAPRPAACPDAQQSPEQQKSPEKSPKSPPPQSACPACLDDLEFLLKERPAIGSHAGPKQERRCFLSAMPEGNRLFAQQPGASTCSLYFVDKTGRVVPPAQILGFDELLRETPLPSSLTQLSGYGRYLGAAVRVRTASGHDVLYIFSDCEVLSSEVCGSVCVPISKPPVCLSRVLAELLRGLSADRKGKPHEKTKTRNECFSKLRVSAEGAVFENNDSRSCRLVLIGPNGDKHPLATLKTGNMRWVGTTPARPPVGSYRFTGYVVVTAKGEVGVYSDCDFPPQESCETIVVGIDTPIPTPVGDPHDDCVDAANDAADQAAWIEVERARGEFERHFKSVHYNRCFGTALRESFSFQAGSREYHYTLRYHDQAGNLVQTVPPEGVAPDSQANPAHRMLSKFRYNSLNQIVAQATPDTGERIFLYDRADRVRFSQNAQQQLDGAFSYRKYDARGRVIETGQVRGLPEATFREHIDEVDFPAASDGTREQIVRTTYDSADTVPVCAPIAPRNLRDRVAAIAAVTSLGVTTLCYSYDVQGHPQTVLRDLPGLGAKVIEYDYDVLTGKVAAIHYQRGQPDALHHRLRFNRLNQIELVETSRDGVLWEADARFSYFMHGPLARLELGADRVQGLDYTYTIDGRPKGLNTGTLTPERDPGHDGLAGGPNAAVARDSVGQTLEFFDGDYKPVGLAVGTLTPASNPHSAALLQSTAGITPSTFALASCSAIGVADGCGLYEGNLARSVLGLEGLDGFARVTGFAYRYDRLYRLTESSSHDGLNPVTHVWPAGPDLSLWRVSLAYDGNGNIASLSRFALTATTPVPAGAWMDQLSYRYATDTQGRLVGNRLEHINDSVTAGAFAQDLDDQGAYTPLNAGTHNYAYDANGDLVRDRAAGLTAIHWNVDSRVSEVEKGAEKFEYLYGGLGQRFAKIHKPSSDSTAWETEYFVRNEQGKLVATYRVAASATPAAPVLEELHLQGGVSLGVIRADGNAPTAVPTGTFAQVRGDKQYQIANYLGHVLATVSDRRITELSSNETIERYAPRVLSATDYDPFGAVQPGRFVEPEAYRFGFNGFERDDELKGSANSYYTQERLFDPRIGRWLSPDPVQLAHASPYAGFSNNPFRFGDPRGQLDWDSFKDTMANVAITARDIGNDAAYVFSGAAVVDAVADNLVKAKEAYGKGQASEAIAHAIGIQGAIESLAAKDLAWQEGGGTVEDRVRMGIGEVTGMNDVARALTGATEFDEELSPAERLQLGIQGSVQVFSVAAGGASLAESAMAPKLPPAARAPKPSVKAPDGPPCPRSFAPGTPVWTVGGLVAIESIVTGDVVLTLHPETGQTGSFEVEALTCTTHADGVRLTIEGPDGQVESLTTTSEHPFWRLGSGWAPAGELNVGDEINGRSGVLRIREISWVPGEFEAYNLSVDEAQTYFVGEQGAWVHNCGVVYKRTDPKTKESYVGQAKSPERFKARKKEHDKKHGVKHDYDVLGEANPGKDLDVLEETKIREQSGLKKEGGTLANKRHQMREERYKKAGGNAPDPNKK